MPLIFGTFYLQYEVLHPPAISSVKVFLNKSRVGIDGQDGVWAETLPSTQSYTFSALVIR